LNVSFNIIREGSLWYVDDNNGFSKAENELGSGVPGIIEHFIRMSDRGRIFASAEPFTDSIKLELISNNSSGVVEYSFQTKDGEITAWLCEVF
jgi:hypothetical protein